MALAGFGWMGVDLFFAISGFLVGGQVLLACRAGAFRWPRFVASRAMRILPPAFALMIAGRIYAGGPPRLDEMAANFLLYGNYANELLWQGHYWSLCVEEHFYLALPAFGLMVAARLRGAPAMTIARLLGLAALAFALLRLVVAEQAPWTTAGQVGFYV